MVRSRANAAKSLSLTSSHISTNSASKPIFLLKHSIKLLDSKDWRQSSLRGAVIENIFLSSSHCAPNSVVVSLLNSATSLLIAKPILSVNDRDEVKHKIEQAIRLLRSQVDICLHSESRRKSSAKRICYKV